MGSKADIGHWSVWTPCRNNGSREGIAMPGLVFTEQSDVEVGIGHNRRLVPCQFCQFLEGSRIGRIRGSSNYLRQVTIGRLRG